MSPHGVAHFAGLPTFPDTDVTINGEIAEGDKAVVCYLWTATHQGNVMGIPATHEQVSEVSGSGAYRMLDGHVAEEWIMEDTLRLLQRLGAMAAPGQGSAATA